MRRTRDIREYRSKLLQRRINKKKAVSNIKQPVIVSDNKDYTPSLSASSEVIQQDIKISILTATFNCEKFIPTAIESVIQQNYNNWELLICDDCSSDNTVNIIEPYKDKEARIKIFKNETKQYCSSTYKKLLAEASGEICCILDGDDCLALYSMETIAKAYKKNPNIDYIYTQFWWCDPKLGNKKKGHSNRPKNGSLLDAEAKGQHFFSHWRTFKTHLREKNELFQPGLKSAVDKYLGYILEETAPGGFLNIPLYFYRRHNQSISSLIKQDNRWKIIEEAKRRRKDNNIKPYPISIIKL